MNTDLRFQSATPDMHAPFQWNPLVRLSSIKLGDAVLGYADGCEVSGEVRSLDVGWDYPARTAIIKTADRRFILMYIEDVRQVVRIR